MATRRHGPRPVFERLYRRFKRAPLPWLARLRRWVIGEHAAAVVVDSANGLLLTPVSDFYIGRKLAQRGAFDTRTVERLLHRVRLGPHKIQHLPSALNLVTRRGDGLHILQSAFGRGEQHLHVVPDLVETILPSNERPDRTVELLLHLVELRELLFELRDPLFSEAQTAGSRFQAFGT